MVFTRVYVCIRHGNRLSDAGRKKKIGKETVVRNNEDDAVWVFFKTHSSAPKFFRGAEVQLRIYIQSVAEDSFLLSRR